MKERVKIACDIMEGISGMQKKKFAHCDLGARNYFVNIKGSTPGHRTIIAYVADFGRTIPISAANDSPVQGNSCYTPPEAIYREKMHGKQYYNSDLFAVGCVFWQLYFGKLPPWSKIHSFKINSENKKRRYQGKVYLINVIRNRVMEKLKPASKKNHTLTLREGFLQIILQMTDPIPSKRGKAIKIYKTLYAMVYRKSPAEKKGTTTSSDHEKANHTSPKI